MASCPPEKFNPLAAIHAYAWKVDQIDVALRIAKHHPPSSSKPQFVPPSRAASTLEVPHHPEWCVPTYSPVGSHIRIRLRPEIGLRPLSRPLRTPSFAENNCVNRLKLDLGLSTDVS